MKRYQVERVRLKPFGWGEANHEHRPEDIMKSAVRDKAEGSLHEMKGKVKEVAGKVTDNPRLEAKGTAEKIAGKVQRKAGQVKKKLGK